MDELAAMLASRRQRLDTIGDADASVVALLVLVAAEQ
jgi:hypothetical protein